MTPPVVLALDTATVVAAGVARGQRVLAAEVVTDRLQHVEQLVPLTRAVLAEAGLDAVDAVVVGLGPGPFTGLRVGIATAQVLATAWGVPLHGVCSLDVLAVQHVAEHPGPPPGEFLVAIDARRKELYWARYAADGTRVDGPRVSDPTALPGLPVVGPGADLYPDRVQAELGPRRLDPGVLAAIGLQLPDAGTEPLYLRRPDATEPSRPKSVLLERSGRRVARGPRP